MRLKARMYAALWVCVMAAAPVAVRADDAPASDSASKPADTLTDKPAGKPAGKDDFADLSLDDLLKTDVSVASSRKSNQRESPGIVTVITADEIARMGARDLADILQQVPGFSFIVDVQGVTGAAFRGNHGYEGKVGIFWDGFELNDLAFATVPLGNRFPVDQIHRIEIIRGPGSAVYGGNSELAVINIVTRLGAEQPGGKLAGEGGFTEKAVSRAGGSLMAGGKPSDDVYVGAMVSGSTSIQSDRNYTDVYGKSYNLELNSNLRPVLAQAMVRTGGFKASLFLEHYRVSQRDDYDSILTNPANLDFGSLAARFTYDGKLSDKVRIMPAFTWRAERPWRYSYTNPAYGATAYHITLTRYQPELKVNCELTPEISVLAGAQYTLDHGSSSDYAFLPPPVVTSQPGSFHRFTAFTEISGYFPEVVNVTVGARVEHHNDYGWVGGPRVALTRVFGDAHVKALYSMAYRTPSIANIWENPVKLEPEYAHVFEVEGGYAFAEKLFVSANFFETYLRKPFAYAYDPVKKVNAYQNFRKTGTRGVEAAARYQDSWGYATLGYSFNDMAGRNRVGIYDVPGHDEVMLAMPNHKVTALASFNVTRTFNVTPSATFTGRRFGYASTDALGNLVYQRYGRKVLLDLFLLWRDSVAKGLDLGVGAHNLLNADFPYLAPYDSYHAPMPSLSREFLGKIAYNW